MRNRFVKKWLLTIADTVTRERLKNQMKKCGHIDKRYFTIGCLGKLSAEMLFRILTNLAHQLGRDDFRELWEHLGDCIIETAEHQLDEFNDCHARQD